MEGYMNTSQAAAALGISITSVSRLINRGVLKAERFGPVWMIEQASVEAYAAETKDKSKHDPTRTKGKQTAAGGTGD